MAKRKNTRMFPRAERQVARSEQLKRAKSVTQEDLDLAVIGEYGRSQTVMAEVWLGLAGEPQREPEEDKLKQALQRVYRQRYGRPLTEDEAEDLVDGRMDW